MKYTIQTENLNFYYGKKNQILKDLNINIPQGAIYGFLGPNGAGKSTTMQLLSGILKDYQGRITIFGKALEQHDATIFNKIGALVESPALYLHLTGTENLKYICTLKGLSVKEIPAILKLVGLEHKGGLKAKKYSLGMKQRLAIGMALLGNPELLFLDEPVNGLDPVGITEMRELLVQLNKERGITIFISSHLLSEIEKMCTHVGIINHGILQFEGTMETLKNLKQKHQVTLTTQASERVHEILTTHHYEAQVLSPDKIQVLLKDKEAIPAMVHFLSAQAVPVYELRSEDGLENWFLSLTK
ncbi:MAG: ATP-binding cassette domain-containing protein [Nonlabens sp.]|nr:ATP-binding cassette domain-containing protein [Nonlabens sp.]